MRKMMQILKKVKDKTNHPVTWWDTLVYTAVVGIIGLILWARSEINFEKYVKKSFEESLEGSSEKEVNE